jgi:Mlc titration factor MtfA (ptsG expression regulator)
MIYHEYDSDGYLVGWHEDAARANSTALAPSGIPSSRARWNGTAWFEDLTRETQRQTAEAQETTKLNQAISAIRTYDPATATANEVRQALGAVIAYLRKHDDRIKP